MSVNGAKDGRSGGSFENPARPANHTPDRTGDGFYQGTGPDEVDVAGWGPNADGTGNSDSFEPTKYDGFIGHTERNTLDSATKPGGN